MTGENHSAFSNVHVMERPAGQDNEIVSAAQAGSCEAFAELYALYSRRLYKTIIAITRNPADAEDALQDTFLRVYSAIHAFEGRSSIYSWLTRIAINSALIILRRRRARAEMLFDPQLDTGSESCSFEFKDSAPNPEQVYDLQQRRVNLLLEISGLDDRLRRPLQMRMTKGSPIKEIGRALNLSEAAVKTRLHRARRQLSTHVRRRDQPMETPSVAMARRDTQLIQASPISGLKITST
jgi:RNA polymerase sigma-70 factor, ECF subfamily